MNTRKIIAALASLTLMASAFSCGSTKSSSGSESSSAVNGTASSSAGTTEAASEDTTEGTNDSSENTAATSSDNDKTTENQSSTSASSEESTTASADSETEQTTSAADSGNSAVTTTTKAPSGSTAATTTAAAVTEPEDEEEEKSYTAEVTLGSDIKVTGENVSVDDTVVKITAGGNYLFTGKLSDGQILVETPIEDESDVEHKVTIVLNGVDIHCSSGPAIMVTEAKKCTIKVKNGTVNNLSDETKDKKNDGVIFSNDTLRIKGKGTLNITANNAHGLSCDDDIIIDNSICNIKAKKSGVIANDDITINGGTLTINAGTNGLKSKEKSVYINGGTTCISSGTKTDVNAVYGMKGVTFAGGALYAAGSQVTDIISSANPFISVELDSTADAGTDVKLSLNGSTAASWKPSNDFGNILMLSAEIASGSKFSVSLDGDSQGEFTVESGSNNFEV